MPSKTAWVTGGNSFTGSYLLPRLREAGYEVTSLVRDEVSEPWERHLDLSDGASVDACFSGARIDLFIHLAAISFVAHEDQTEIYKVNTIGTERLLAALARLEVPPRVVVASSANVYGNPESLPCFETSPLRPENHYAISKYGAEQACRWFADQLEIVIARPFNYTGVGQRENFLVPKIVAAFNGENPEIELGNLDIARDFLDVRDVANAYLALAESGVPGDVYNVASGTAIELGQIVTMLEDLSGKSLSIAQNPKFMRANELKVLEGNSDKLRALGWTLDHQMSDTLAWMLKR